jgi:hypothetical protein
MVNENVVNLFLFLGKIESTTTKLVKTETVTKIMWA